MKKAKVHGLPMFTNVTPINNGLNKPPRLQVVIDTEEEFDWSKGPDRTKTSVKHLEHIGLVQDIFNQYSITPCYAVDYPVAASTEHNHLLIETFKSGLCEIGAHLHPWVNPPFREPLSIANMYPGNLPAELEKQKLELLTEKIEETFGFRPIVYKAGRYGFGPNTQAILASLGYMVDLSVCPTFDHSYDGGPDYRTFGVTPFHFGNRLLEIPLTAAYVGCAGRWSPQLYQLGNTLRKLKVPGIFSRLGLVDRLVLSPEGFTTEEHLKLTKFLLKNSITDFTWSFHSSSITVGNTSYVQNKQQLNEFLDRFKRYFDFFFGTLGGVATSPTQFRNMMEKQ